jgi:hypothetical protein
MDKITQIDSLSSYQFTKMLEVADAAADIVTIRQLEPALGTQSPHISTKPTNPSINTHLNRISTGAYVEICNIWAIMRLEPMILRHVTSPYSKMSITKLAIRIITHPTKCFVDGKWMVVDLTFGFHFDGRLSWEDARERYFSGQAVGIIKIDGGRQALESYSVPLKDLVKFMAIETCPGEDDYCLYSPSGDWGRLGGNHSVV